MIRITRMTDYGIVLMTHFARNEAGSLQSARDLAGETGLPLPTVNKVLKLLTRRGLLESHRGAKGGYQLAHRPEEISVAAIIDATEGPVGLTECAVEGSCDHEPTCPVRGNWQLINQAVTEALEKISLSQMCHPLGTCAVLPASMVTLHGIGTN